MLGVVWVVCSGVLALFGLGGLRGWGSAAFFVLSVKFGGVVSVCRLRLGRGRLYHRLCRRCSGSVSPCRGCCGFLFCVVRWCFFVCGMGGGLGKTRVFAWCWIWGAGDRCGVVLSFSPLVGFFAEAKHILFEAAAIKEDCRYSCCCSECTHSLRSNVGGGVGFHVFCLVSSGWAGPLSSFCFLPVVHFPLLWDPVNVLRSSMMCKRGLN